MTLHEFEEYLVNHGFDVDYDPLGNAFRFYELDIHLYVYSADDVSLYVKDDHRMSNVDEAYLIISQIIQAAEDQLQSELCESDSLMQI